MAMTMKNASGKLCHVALVKTDALESSFESMN
jgi:hypothetical protein